MTGTGARWLVGALIAACVLLAGPSAPDGAYIAKPLPAGAPPGSRAEPRHDVEHPQSLQGERP